MEVPLLTVAFGENQFLSWQLTFTGGHFRSYPSSLIWLTILKHEEFELKILMHMLSARSARGQAGR